VAEIVAELLGDRARRHVGAGAGDERDDEANGPVGIISGRRTKRDERNQRERGAGGGATATDHALLDVAHRDSISRRGCLLL
jgi:hypothetical protein